MKPRTDEVRRVERVTLIRVTSLRGTGTPNDVYREVDQFWEDVPTEGYAVPRKVFEVDLFPARDLETSPATNEALVEAPVETPQAREAREWREKVADGVRSTAERRRRTR